jgi:hypothetical protein
MVRWRIYFAFPRVKIIVRADCVVSNTKYYGYYFKFSSVAAIALLYKECYDLSQSEGSRFWVLFLARFDG